VFPEAVARALDPDDDRVVEQAIQERRGDDRGLNAEMRRFPSRTPRLGCGSTDTRTRIRVVTVGRSKVLSDHDMQTSEAGNWSNVWTQAN